MTVDLPTELTNLRRRILTMAASVNERVNQALDGLLHGDFDAARIVVRSDDEIDQMEVDIEQRCLKVLALQHPVAGDLRFVLSVMRINTDLERIADMARSIAKRALNLKDASTTPIPPAIGTMSEYARQMLAESLASLADEDPALARKVRRADNRVDDLQKEMFAWVQEQIPQQVENTRALLDILSVARKLERIADVATNIAEDVIFLAEGEVVRHAEA